MPPQSIPPDADQLDEYYLFMKEKGMMLIAHTGPEHTIPTNENNRDWQDWGNPLRFRKALQMASMSSLRTAVIVTQYLIWIIPIILWFQGKSCFLEWHAKLIRKIKQGSGRAKSTGI